MHNTNVMLIQVCRNGRIKKKKKEFRSDPVTFHQQPIFLVGAGQRGRTSIMLSGSSRLCVGSGALQSTEKLQCSSAGSPASILIESEHRYCNILTNIINKCTVTQGNKSTANTHTHTYPPAHPIGIHN